MTVLTFNSSTEFEASLICILNFKTAKATRDPLSQKEERVRYIWLDFGKAQTRGHLSLRMV